MVKKTKTNKANKTLSKTNKNDTQTEDPKPVSTKKAADLQIDKYSTVSDWLGRKRKSSRQAIIHKNSLKGHEPAFIMRRISEENFEALKDPRVRPSAIMRKQELEDVTVDLRRGYVNMCCHYPDATFSRSVPHYFWKRKSDKRLFPNLYFSKKEVNI